jgi:hypothetical protein
MRNQTDHRQFLLRWLVVLADQSLEQGPCNVDCFEAPILRGPSLFLFAVVRAMTELWQVLLGMAFLLEFCTPSRGASFLHRWPFAGGLFYSWGKGAHRAAFQTR